MGCDIHPHIEYRHSESESYELFASPNWEQSYLLFALLADVRKDWVKEQSGLDVSALYAPRGIPADISDEARCGDDGCDYWSENTRTWEFDAGCHSGSWLNTDELCAVIENYLTILGDLVEGCKEKYGFEHCVELHATLKAMEVLPNARLIFWFDN